MQSGVKTFFNCCRINIILTTALIIFESGNELHLTPFLIKKSNYEIKEFNEIS